MNNKQSAEYLIQRDQRVKELEQQRDELQTRYDAAHSELVRLQNAALVETTALCTNYESVEEDDGYKFTEAPAVIKQGDEAIEAFNKWEGE